MELILKHSYSRKTNKKGNIERKPRNETQNEDTVNFQISMA